MSLTSQNLLTTSHSRLSLYFTNTHFKNPNSPRPSQSTIFKIRPNFQTLNSHSLNFYNFRPLRNHFPLRAFQSDRPLQNQNAIDDFNLDAVLSIAEVLCLASSAIISIASALNFAFSSSQKPVLAWLGARVSVWQFLLMVSGVVIGAVIRRRQWRRICMDFSKPDGSGVNLIERIEKLEEDIGSSVTIVRALSRKLEKLGIRFRVSRKAIKEPIAEAIALAQQNSEATRALAVQEEILEKEIGEIQKYLLAMQDQQQKQLELICVIGKTGKFFEEKKERSQNQARKDTHSSTKKEEIKQIPVNQNLSYGRTKETQQ